MLVNFVGIFIGKYIKCSVWYLVDTGQVWWLLIVEGKDLWHAKKLRELRDLQRSLRACWQTHLWFSGSFQSQQR